MHVVQGSDKAAEHPFEFTAAAFSTFLYAAAVHLVIHHAHRPGGSPPESAFIAVLLVGFVFSDWSSRTRLPNLTGDRMSAPILLLKTLLEICAVYFLVSSFIMLVEHADQPLTADPRALSPYSAFGAFLVLTWLWDLFMLGVMKELTWGNLASSLFQGDAVSKKEFKSYLAHFEKWQADRAGQIEKKRTEIMAAVTAGEDGHAASQANLCLVIKFVGQALDANLAVLMQLLANHVAHANLVAGVVIILRETGRLRPECSFLSRAIAWWWNVDVLWAVGIGITVTFLAALVGGALRRVWFWWIWWISVLLVGLGFLTQPGILGPWSVFVSDVWRAIALGAFLWMLWTLPFYATDSKWARRIGGVFIFLTLLLLYFLLPSKGLMILLAVQQVFANVFLQLAVVTPWKPSDKNARESTCHSLAV